MTNWAHAAGQATAKMRVDVWKMVVSTTENYIDEHPNATARDLLAEFERLRADAQEALDNY